ncbi:nuclease-related domain-containing protein [Rhizobium sp.]|uniref:nuclease-related domain-containing protein n=1 Tax=Rhizobium sp. TaxID=391 RepID=UPI0028A9FC97
MIDQKIFDAAAKSRTSGPLVDHLRLLQQDQELADEIANLIRWTATLVDKRPNPTGAAARGLFLESIREALLEGNPDVDLTNFQKAVELIQITEEGLHRILSALSQTEFAQEPPALRASAILARAEGNRVALAAAIDDAIKVAGQLTMPAMPEIKTATGEHIDGDSVISRILESLRGTLVMEGYANGWFGGSKRWLVLPALPAAGDREIELAFQSEFLANSWALWERLCEKARFSDDIIKVLGPERLIEAPVKDVVRVFERPPTGPIADFVANERAIDREGKSAADYYGRTNLSTLGKGVSGTVKPSPEEWVTSEEALSALALSEGVGFNIVEDKKRYGGLTLLQWIRGYMALSAWVSESLPVKRPMTIELNPNEARDFLARMSLTSTEADIFFDAISFGANSRDLYDAPLVRTQDKWLLISAAFTAPRMARIVPSLLASLKIQITDKGPKFEKRVIDFFRSKGLDAKGVTVKRNNEVYDYDVLVPWDSYIFHFECKNHGLSGNDPRNWHHFLQETAFNIKQVDRLRGGLKEWPDIVGEAFGEDAKTKTVIQCILNNETFSFPEGINETLLYDWSALTRFFESPFIGIVQDHRGPGGVVIRGQVEVKRIWAGDEPTAEDLLIEMRDPSQFRIVEHHAKMSALRFQLDKETVAIDYSFMREPGTHSSYAEALGVSGEQIEDQVTQMTANMQELIARMEAAAPQAKSTLEA